MLNISGANVLRFYRKLEDLNIGVLTFVLAFHIHKTALLRFPYDKKEFFEQVQLYTCNCCIYDLLTVQQLHPDEEGEAAGCC